MTYKIINDNNCDALSSIQKDSIDSCITDPPYGMNIANMKWDNNVPPVKNWKSVYRVLKPGAFVLSFCSPEYYHRMATKIEDAGFRPLDMIFWIVTTKMAKANRLKPAHEPIMVAQKPLEGSIKNNVKNWGCGEIDIEPARVPWEGKPPTGWASNSHSRRAFGSEVAKARNQQNKKVDANPNGRYPSNVIGHLDDHQKYFYAPRASRKERADYNDHPTPKPISLMRYLVDIYCPKGGIVLDPFCGSGSTGIAALESGREFIGIDIDKHYCEITEKRIKEIGEASPLESFLS